MAFAWKSGNFSLKPKLVITITLLFLTVSIFSLLPSRVNLHAAGSTARLEVWSPQIGGPNGSNITSLTLFPVGTQFKVLVNVTGAGPIGGFDISLNYNLTSGPNVLQWVHPTNSLDPLTGGLIDPNNIPSTCPSGTRVRQASPPDIDFPAGNIRYSPLFQGGCTVNGTGILLTLFFKVTGVGAGSIDIVTATGNGRSGSTIGGNGINGPTAVPYTPYGAYFRNKPGIPPVATFSITPQTVHVADKVFFNATQSYDPEHPSNPNKGISPESVVYDSDGSNTYNSEPVILGATPLSGSVLAKDGNILYVDSNHNNRWDAGETVVDDTGGTLTFTIGDVLIAGAAPPVGTQLSFDPKIRFVDTHTNAIWDNGYVWDFGDGTPLVTGNLTYHVFVFSGSIPAAGSYPVKLVVYDADDNLPMRQVTVITIQFAITYDVTVGLVLSADHVKVGDPLTVTVRLTNRGNRDVSANLNVSYSLNGGTSIAKESGITMTVSQVRTFPYTLQTGSLAPGAYTVFAGAKLFNITTGDPIPYTFPVDSSATTSFVVNPPQPQTFLSLPILAGAAVGAVAIVSATVYMLRRRRKEDI